MSSEAQSATASTIIGDNGETRSEPLDWDELRRRSLQPGGFGEDRTKLWTQLLNVQLEERNEVPGSEDTSSTDEHPDERQIRLDTDRSFVLYPVDGLKEREVLQSKLHDLIVSVFRKRRRLSYFQGYHDIISVIFLTLPEELQMVAAEKMSLHRIRDSMGSSLEPVLGLLRVLKRVLSLADPEYAALLESVTPLPYFALSNLLTLFSHDVPTLPLIQHIFDYLLSRPPVYVVYLAAAVVLARKEEVKKLTEDEEEGMIHSLLSSLPDLYEDEEAQPTKEDVYEPLEPPRSEPNSSETGEEYPSEAPESSRQQHGDETVVAEITISSDVDQSQLNTLVEIDPALSTKEEKLPSSLHEHETESSTNTSVTSPDIDTPAATQPSSDTVSNPSHASHASTSRPLTPTSRPTTPLVAEPESGSLNHRARISLPSLLQHADMLHTLYPPTHPSIALDTIMGPQSVTRTWSEKTDEMPADDEAEKMVSRMDLIVFPTPPEEFTKEKEEGDGDYETEEEGRTKEKKRRRRKLQKTPRAYTRHIIPIRRKTMVASAVLVLGVAVAVYGTGGLRGLSGGDGRGHGQGHRELRSIGRFVGALLVGAGERLLDSIWG